MQRTDYGSNEPVAGSVDEPTGHVAQVATSAKDSAKENAKQVASTSKEQTKQVVNQATDKARDLVGDARSQLRSQAQDQTQRLSGTLDSLANELRSMAERADDPQGMAATTARQASNHAADFADRLDRQGFDGVVEDVKRFGRNRPGLFLLGAIGAGFAAGRLFRNADTKSLVDAAKPGDSDQPSIGQTSNGEQPSSLAPSSSFSTAIGDSPLPQPSPASGPMQTPGQTGG